MIKKRWLRLTLGTILGGFSGLSLTSSVLPSILALVADTESFFVRFALGGYAAHATLAWAVGGWLVVRSDSPKIGATIMGMVGVITGVVVTMMGLGSETKLLAAGGLAAGFYGMVGGMLIGTILRSPDETGSDSALS